MELIENLKKRWVNKLILSEIEPRFTPRISTADGSLSGAEVSIFWNDKAPDEFMEAAKKLGIANQIYDELVKKSIPYLKEALSLNPRLKFAFKLYRLQVESVETIDNLLEVFNRNGVPLRNLEFESDAEFVRLGDLGVEILNKLRRLAITVDFVVETGEEICFPVNLFKEILISKIKLKRELVKDLVGESNSLRFERGVKFLRATVGFFKRLDLSVLASGVDKKEEFDLLSVLGADEVQGYLFGENLRGEEFINLVKVSAKRVFVF